MVLLFQVLSDQVAISFQLWKFVTPHKPPGHRKTAPGSKTSLAGAEQRGTKPLQEQKIRAIKWNNLGGKCDKTKNKRTKELISLGRGGKILCIWGILKQVWKGEETGGHLCIIHQGQPHLLISWNNTKINFPSLQPFQRLRQKQQWKEVFLGVCCSNRNKKISPRLFLCTARPLVKVTKLPQGTDLTFCLPRNQKTSVISTQTWLPAVNNTDEKKKKLHSEWTHCKSLLLKVIKNTIKVRTGTENWSWWGLGEGKDDFPWGKEASSALRHDTHSFCNSAQITS